MLKYINYKIIKLFINTCFIIVYLYIYYGDIYAIIGQKYNMMVLIFKCPTTFAGIVRLTLQSYSSKHTKAKLIYFKYILSI